MLVITLLCVILGLSVYCIVTQQEAKDTSKTIKDLETKLSNIEKIKPIVPISEIEKIAKILRSCEDVESKIERRPYSRDGYVRLEHFLDTSVGTFNSCDEEVGYNQVEMFTFNYDQRKGVLTFSFPTFILEFPLAENELDYLTLSGLFNSSEIEKLMYSVRSFAIMEDNLENRMYDKLIDFIRYFKMNNISDYSTSYQAKREY